MGVYNRDYYRELPSGASGLMPVVKGLIIANAAVFVLQMLAVRDPASSLADLRERFPQLEEILDRYPDDGPEALDAVKREQPDVYRRLTHQDRAALMGVGQTVSPIQEWCQLDTRKVVRNGQIWRLLTHAFCHDRYSIFHIVFNMLLLYWFGGTLEAMYGSREFLLFYLTAAVVAGLTYIGLDLWTGSTVPAVGASGAVIAVMMLYTIHFPRETICVCWFFPIEMRWLMLFYLLYDLHPILLALSGDRLMTGVAHAAHLGGLVFGFLYGHYQWRLDPLLDRVPGIGRLGELEARHPTIRIRPDRTDEDTARMDGILRKISAAGQESLTDEERAVLRAASERLKRRPRCER
jgi:membrane associated rhomboid family serine protease